MIHIPVNIAATPPKTRKVRRKARHSRNASGSLHLLPLPLGLGLYYGKGFGDCSPAIRSWEYARYDYADHSPQDSERWSWVQLGKPVQAAHPFAAWFDDWDSRRFWKRMARKAKADCVTCEEDSKQYADIGRAGYECRRCYESGVEG